MSKKNQGTTNITATTETTQPVLSSSLDQKDNLPLGIECPNKDMTIKEIRDIVTQAMSSLNSMDEYDQQCVMKILKFLAKVSVIHDNHRKEIGDLLSKLRYTDIIVRFLNQLANSKTSEILLDRVHVSCMNYCDCSKKLAKSLAESGVVKQLTSITGSKRCSDILQQSKSDRNVLNLCLDLLYNIARWPGVKHHFEESKTVEILMPFTKCNDQYLKCMVMLTLAFIVDEEDNGKLVDDRNTIQDIVNLTEMALADEEKKVIGFSLCELIHGLTKLAVNDENKSKIVKAGALDIFLKIMQNDDPEEQETVAECIWNLSFDKAVRKKILEFPNLAPALEALKDSKNTKVKKSVTGALWMIKGHNDQPIIVSRPGSSRFSKNHNTGSTNTTPGHIFISYSWSENELVQKIYSSLKSQGFCLWLDKDQMSGSTLQAMAEAVQESTLVLVCMSEKYIDSANCRTEAEYTYERRKEYIPLKVQPNFRPDGWLGAMMASRLYFDFCGQDSYEDTLEKLIKEIGARSKHMSSSFDEPDGKRDSVASNISKTVAAPAAKSPKGCKSDRCVAMSKENVETLLASSGLQKFNNLFSEFDGRLLWQLKKMKETDTAYYHKSLEKQFGMSLIDVLRFNAALDSLK